MALSSSSTTSIGYSAFSSNFLLWKARLGKTYIPSQSRSWQYLMVFRHRNWISRLTTFGNQWNRRNNWTSGQNQRETIETSETIKTIEWWTSAYLRRQTKEVEIINRWRPIIHSNSSSSCTETRRIQILENRNDHTVIVQFSDISITKYSDLVVSKWFFQKLNLWDYFLAQIKT